MGKSGGYTTVAPNIRKYLADDGSVAYRIQVTFRGRTVTETRLRLGEARHRRDEIKAELRGGTSADAYRYTVGQAIAEFRLAMERGELGHRLQGRGAYLDWWEGRLGRDRLVDVTPPRITQELQTLMLGASPSGRPVSRATANRYHSALSRVLSHVAALGWLPHNPARLVRRRPEAASPGRELSDDERRRLLAAAAADVDWRVGPLVTLAVWQGARQGELLRLCWGDLDAERRMAVLRVTKSGKSRSMPLFEPALDTLLELRRTRRRVDTDLVFGAPIRRRGRPQSPFPRDAWYRVRKAAELGPEADGRAYRFHGLRHDCACRLARSGASDSEMMLILGWEAREMINRYAHLRPESGRAALERMGRETLERLGRSGHEERLRDSAE